jgi:hypothetical protein
MKRYFPYLLMLIFLSILIGANIYLVHRFNFYFSSENPKIFYIIFPALTLLMFFGVFPLSNAISRTGSLVYIVSASTMGILLYLLISVLTVDFISLFIKFTPGMRHLKLMDPACNQVGDCHKRTFKGSSGHALV